ncbi:hypothetical protein QTP88_015425 [Uroleucon formosanum]
MSDDNIHRRTLCITNDIEYQVVEKINKSIFYAIQLGESTDISNSAVLLLIYGKKAKEAINFITAITVVTITSATIPLHYRGIMALGIQNNSNHIVLWFHFSVRYNNS